MAPPAIRIERRSSGKKQKTSDENCNNQNLQSTLANVSSVPVTAEVKSLPKGCLASLSTSQIAEMKRFLTAPADRPNSYTHRDLPPMWERMGMTARYLVMTGKVKVIEKMKIFAEKNLEGHGL